MKRLFLVPALIAVLALLPAARTTAQTFTTLHSFTFSDGATPYSELVLSGNTLYGTASAGGNSGSYSNDCIKGLTASKRSRMYESTTFGSGVLFMAMFAINGKADLNRLEVNGCDVNSSPTFADCFFIS
jgi:hypothetical protein